MKRYIVALTIDRHPPGTDVTDTYPEFEAQELVRFGYLEEVETEPEKPQAQPKRKRSAGGE